MEDSENLLDDIAEEQSTGWDDPPVRRQAGTEAGRAGRRRGVTAKPLRQRIEEYFERKRLREALEEDVDDSIFS